MKLRVKLKGDFMEEGKGGICNAMRRRGYCYGYKHHMASLRITSYRAAPWASDNDVRGRGKDGIGENELLRSSLPSSKSLPTAIPTAGERLLFGMCPLVSLDMFNASVIRREEVM
jgi:hypothetical protein